MGKRIKVGTAIIVIKDGKILTGIRKGSHGEGTRSFPGGHFEEDDESLIQSARRELMEECGIEVDFLKATHGGYDFFTTTNICSETARYITIYLAGLYKSGGTWDNGKLIGQEPEKCEVWELMTLEEINSQIETHVWIPVERIKKLEKDLHI